MNAERDKFSSVSLGDEPREFVFNPFNPDFRDQADIGCGLQSSKEQGTRIPVQLLFIGFLVLLLLTRAIPVPILTADKCEFSPMLDPENAEEKMNILRD